MISITAACDSEAELMKPPLKPRPLLECHFNLRTGDGFSPGKGLEAQNIIAREDQQKINKGGEPEVIPASRSASSRGPEADLVPGHNFRVARDLPEPQRLRIRIQNCHIVSLRGGTI
jgi:hypothetical protein